MSNIGEILAVRYVSSLMKKQANVDPTEARRQFERALKEEEVLRGHASRMSELAASREREHPKGVGAGLGTFASHLTPMPYSLSEAAIKLPAIAAGAGLGAAWGADRASVTPQAVSEIFSLDNKVQKALEARLRDQATANPQGVTKLLDDLRRMSPDDAAKVLRDMPSLGVTSIKDKWSPLRNLVYRTDEQQKATEAIKAVMGEDGISKLRKAFSAVKPIKEVPSFLARVFGSKHVLLPALIGGGLASAGVGAAFGVPAIINHMRGGPGAVSARNRAQEAIDRAEQLRQSREEVLQQLEQLSQSKAGA